MHAQVISMHGIGTGRCRDEMLFSSSEPTAAGGLGPWPTL